MKHCPSYQSLLAESLFGNPSEEDRKQLQAHVDTCAECREALVALQATLHQTQDGIRVDPPEAYWNTYFTKLEARRTANVHPFFGWARWWEQGTSGFSLESFRWAYRLSGAMAILALGIFVGWLLFRATPANPPPVATQEDIVLPENPAAEEPVRVEAPQETHVAETPRPRTNPDTPLVKPVVLEGRTTRYLERSKVLLLGLVHLKADDDPSFINLEKKRQVARELIDESKALKQTLSTEDERLLLSLIDDLEVILLQIANLEATYDLAAIEMVQRGVDRQALMLKINVTEMRRGDMEVAPAAEEQRLKAQ